jgi:hypothetical protein
MFVRVAGPLAVIPEAPKAAVAVTFKFVLMLAACAPAVASKATAKLASRRVILVC